MSKIERFEDLKSWQKVYLALDRNYITESQLQKVCNLATEVKRLINGLIGYLNR